MDISKANSIQEKATSFILSNAGKVLSRQNENIQKQAKNIVKRSKDKPKKSSKEPLKHFMYDDKVECGIDEAGRGPLFGRVYTACVILPNDDSFNHSMMKDSKRFTSKKKLMEAYNYILENAIDYCVTYKTEEEIDTENILQATLNCMKLSIDGLKHKPNHILVDGNHFKPYTGSNGKVTPYTCVEGGDNEYTCIAAASILAKVERDAYIESIVEENPLLDTYYQLSSNKGYGTKHHLTGLKEHGLSPWHRKSFGICKKLNLANEFKMIVK